MSHDNARCNVAKSAKTHMLTHKFTLIYTRYYLFQLTLIVIDDTSMADRLFVSDKALKKIPKN